MLSSIEPFDPLRHGDLLHDESRATGSAELVAQPRSEEEISEVLRECAEKGIPVTVQGSRTGITGGAVPPGGCILNLSRMAAVTELRFDDDSGQAFVSVEPGMKLEELTKVLRELKGKEVRRDDEGRGGGEEDIKRPFFFPVDPTETTASIGGMVSCNASGSRSLRYGPTRAYVSALRLVFADGTVRRLRRGECRAHGRSFQLDHFQGALPSYRMPATKNAAGYYVGDDMDLLDLFVGMEGTLAVVSQVELRLCLWPGCIWGLTVFLPSEQDTLRLVRELGSKETATGARGRQQGLAALEYFDGDALALLRRVRERGGAFSSLPEIAPEHGAALYVEYHGTEEEVSGAAEKVGETVESLGGNSDSIWLATEPLEIERMKFFRHAVPEAINLLIDEYRAADSSVTKLGTDMAVPGPMLERTMTMYRNDLRAAGLQGIIFGHIGDYHLHVNIIPRTRQEYSKGRELYMLWAQRIVAWGGSVSAEHGIGKLKRDLLEIMYGSEGVAQMRAVKRAFDPKGVLNRGNLFAWEPEK